MELLRNTLPVLILAALLLLSPLLHLGPVPDLCLVCGMVAATLVIGGILILFG